MEALLFVTKEPLSLERLSDLLEEEQNIVLRWLMELQHEYKGRGVQIRQVAGGFEMVTADDCHDIIEKVVPKTYDTLSRSSLETITIVAYNQPVKRSLIARFRGVANPDHGIAGLLEHGLIKETEEGYVTTPAFLKYFGINDLKELPEIILPEEGAKGEPRPETSDGGDEEIEEGPTPSV